MTVVFARYAAVFFAEDYLLSLVRMSSAAFLPDMSIPPKIGPMRYPPMTLFALMPQAKSPGKYSPVLSTVDLSPLSTHIGRSPSIFPLGVLSVILALSEARRMISLGCPVPSSTHSEITVSGMGGIMNGDDAIEFFLAGASAVAVGTANFVDPFAPLKVIDGINAYLDRHGYSSIRDIVGKLEI